MVNCVRDVEKRNFFHWLTREKTKLNKEKYELRHQPKHSPHWQRTGTFDDLNEAMRAYQEIRNTWPAEWAAVYDLMKDRYVAKSTDER